MIRRLFRQPAVGAGLIAALLIGTSTTAAPGPGSPQPIAKGWGWLIASGTVSGVDPTARTATLAIAGQGRLETFEGAGSWRRQTVTGAQVVHLLQDTVITDGEDAVLTMAAVHVGVPAMVWGVVRPDASVLGLKLRMAPASKAPPGPATVTAYAISGAVLRWSGTMLEVLTVQGTSKSVIVTSATVVRNASGGTASPTTIALYDVVRVEGSVNSDGSVAASRIDRELEAAGAARVAGAVDQVFGDIEGLVVGGVMVPIPPGCYFIKGSAPSTFKQLLTGQPVTVYGTSISTGSTLVGLRARVVVGR